MTRLLFEEIILFTSLKRPDWPEMGGDDAGMGLGGRVRIGTAARLRGEAQDSPYFQIALNIPLNAGCSAGIWANCSTRGRRRCCGMVGMSSWSMLP